MSKAASKTIQMNYMKVDLVGLIRQAELENEEKIREAHLEFRWKLPEDKVVLWLDSEKTYRIFENLIVNITKYAMPHTRVYIEMNERPDDVQIFMKNVSGIEFQYRGDHGPFCKRRFFKKYRRIWTWPGNCQELCTATAW